MKNNDSLIYASLVSTMLKERNPIILIGKEMGRMVKMVVNLKKDMQLLDDRLAKKQEQYEQMENFIDQTRVKRIGGNINTTR